MAFRALQRSHLSFTAAARLRAPSRAFAAAVTVMRPAFPAHLAARGEARSFATDSASHSDFQTVHKTPPESHIKSEEEVRAIIENDINSHNVFIYMKGNPAQPRCGFSNYVTQVFRKLGVEHGHRDVLEDMNIREGIKHFSDWPTIPQVFFKGEFVGGCDIINAMYKDGSLTKTMEDMGIYYMPFEAPQRERFVARETAEAAAQPEDGSRRPTASELGFESDESEQEVEAYNQADDDEVMFTGKDEDSLAGGQEMDDLDRLDDDESEEELLREKK